MTLPDPTRRTAITLVASALAAGTIAISLAVAATQPKGCPVDPVHEAIRIHAQTVARTDAENARLTAAGGPDVADWSRLRSAFATEIAAGKALIATAPTSQAGVEALERHLNHTRYSSTVRYIRRKVEYEGHGVVIVGGDAAAAWLVAGHRERLGAA
jgi:hypothetical protein